MYKVIVYDCDGVIVNSGAAILSYYNWMMNKCGLPPVDWTEEELRLKALSMPDKDILEMLAAGNGKLYEKMLEISKNESNDPSYDEMSLETGLVEGLEIVKKRGLPMAVFTNRGKSLLNLLEHFKIKNYFRMCVTACDVSRPKPSPEGLLKICRYFGADPSESLFIGDSPTDYYAAEACGASFVAFKKSLWNAPVIYDHREIAVKL